MTQIQTNTPLTPTDLKLAGDQITAIQHAMKLSDDQLVEALGLSPGSGRRRLRRWKAGELEIAPSTAKLLLLLHRLDNAIKVIDIGEWDRGHEMLRSALPDFLQ